MIYKFIALQKAEFPVNILCRVCKVSSSSYYAYLNRQDDIKARNDITDELKSKIKQSYESSRCAYGAPRIAADLNKHGIHISRAKVARLLVSMGLSAKCRRNPKRTTRSDSNAIRSVDLVNRNFTANSPNEVFVSDLTYIPTKGGHLYLAAILDVYSRMIVGYEMGTYMTTELFVESLSKLSKTRKQSKFNGAIFHSDHGSQYCSREFRATLKAMGMKQSMGAVGDSYDNAMAESIWASLKKELVYKTKFETQTQARQEIISWIDWYNNERIHTSIGYVSPVEFESKNLEQSA